MTQQSAWLSRSQWPLLPGISRQEHSGWLVVADLLHSERLVDINEGGRRKGKERYCGCLWWVYKQVIRDADGVIWAGPDSYTQVAP